MSQADEKYRKQIADQVGIGFEISRCILLHLGIITIVVCIRDLDIQNLVSIHIFQIRSFIGTGLESKPFSVTAIEPTDEGVTYSTFMLALSLVHRRVAINLTLPAKKSRSWTLAASILVFRAAFASALTDHIFTPHAVESLYGAA